MVINNEYIPPGTSKMITLNIARLPTHTVIDIPIYVFRSKKEGPTLLLMAGLHGDEINGVEIIRRMIVEKTIIPKQGSVIAIPILNIYGFLNFARYVPDGKDVNRSFPGNPHGSLASRVAYTFMHEILPHIDFGIDFHTGAASRSNFPQIRCVFDNGTNLMLARAFAPPFILNSPLIDKSLRKAAAKMGKSIIVYEGGEALRFNEKAIEEGIAGTIRLMHHLGMTSRYVEPAHQTVELLKSTWKRANSSGLFRYFIKNGQYIRKNQLLATITDPYGEYEVKLKAKVSGHVICVNNNPIVNQGDALIHVGMEG